MNAATVFFRSLIVFLGISAVPPCVVAQTAQELGALMPGLPIKAGQGGALTLGDEFRQSEFTPIAKGFELRLHWNGIDNDDWPFEKLVSTIAGSKCGAVSQQTVSGQVERLYKTKSLIRGRELGGNAGETFKRQLIARLGQCNASYLAEGARWHTLTVIVTRP